MSSVRITALNVRKRFGLVTALDDLSLSVEPGSHCIGVLGRNGAGKTTLLRILVGLLQADGGRIEVEIDGTKCSAAGPRQAVYIAEHTMLIPSITGWQHLRLYEDLNRLAGVQVDSELRDDLIEQFGLAEHLAKAVGQMSKGNQRKLELVAAISSDVPLVIADELTEGLDIPSRISLESALRDLSRTFILSSHDLSFITGVVDALFIIDHGQLVDSFAVGADTPAIKDRVARAFGTLEPVGRAAPTAPPGL